MWGYLVLLLLLLYVIINSFTIIYLYIYFLAEAATNWEVSDGRRGYVQDIYLRAEEMTTDPES